MRVTFEKEKNLECKEKYEWMRVWCDDTQKNDKPRVLLIGDSITEGYYEIVKQALIEKAYVDYLATSYAIDRWFLQDLINQLIVDSTYAVVHFNNGLHGYHVTKQVYEQCLKKIVDNILNRSPIIIATTTSVKDEKLEKENDIWKEKVLERNDVVREITYRYGIGLNDLYKVSRHIAVDKCHPDGVHYEAAGYTILAKSVIDSLERYL